jgi:hypothetical protein
MKWHLSNAIAWVILFCSIFDAEGDSELAKSRCSLEVFGWDVVA